MAQCKFGDLSKSMKKMIVSITDITIVLYLFIYLTLGIEENHEL